VGNARKFDKQGKFDVLSQVLMKIQVFWAMTPCSKYRVLVV